MKLEQRVAARLLGRRQTLATAESCTGGWLAKRLTDVPGSSAWFLEGVVVYANAAKVRLLGIAPDLIDQYGAVSAEVAGAMATRCRAQAGSDYALAITGVAGPGGGTAEKPVGLVFVGLACSRPTVVERLCLDAESGRPAIRAASCDHALTRLLAELDSLG